MTSIKNLGDTYSSCVADGFIHILKETDVELVSNLLRSAALALERAKLRNNEFEKRTNNYSFIFVEYYDILRRLLDAFILLDRAKIENHQCLNAYICTKHIDLDFDWETLETMRLLRNNVNYKGKTIDESVWKHYKVRFEVYTNVLIRSIKDKLG